MSLHPDLPPGSAIPGLSERLDDPALQEELAALFRTARQRRLLREAAEREEKAS